MNEQDKKQILALIQTLEEQKSYVPFVQDFLKHPIYGPLFKSFKDSEIQEVKHIIKEYIEEKINGQKTKGGQYFQRFFETMNAEFWTFRELNSDESNLDNPQFHTLGKKIEQELFRYEGLLTESMLHRPESLDKVVGAFYNIVYRYFPLFGRISTE